MALKVYSTLTRRKEPFHKEPGEAVSMYVCGPTVYKLSHIGHMVGPVIFDTVKRYLAYLGYKVTWVVNITDVDDKLIKRAGELNTTVPELAARMTEDYIRCLNALNVRVGPDGIDDMPKATEHIPGMVAMISRLVEKGHAYPAGGDVYFDVSKDADYGKLCNRDPGQLEAGTRIEVSDRKRNPGDFALWKGAKPSEPAEVQFDSPWGKGRPGWHIECSAMATKLLGDTLDIHGGGLDLTFPHHENELAQSESATGKDFARVWMHNGLLKLKDKDGHEAKMAGSIGNVLNVTDALKHVPGDALRFFMLKTHYRTPIDLGIWDWNNPDTPIPNGLVEAKKAHQTFDRFAELVQRVAGASFGELSAPTTVGGDRSFTKPEFTEAYRQFRDYMDDDFNTGGAVGVLFELVNRVNKVAHDAKLEAPVKASDEAKPQFMEGATLVKEMAQLLGLTFRGKRHFSLHLEGAVTVTDQPVLTKHVGTFTGAVQGGDGAATGQPDIVSGLMQLLLDLRNNLRTEAKAAAKDNPLKKALFDQTDLIRKRLGELGVTLEDRPGGTTWRVG